MTPNENIKIDKLCRHGIHARSKIIIFKVINVINKHTNLNIIIFYETANKKFYIVKSKIRHTN